MSDIEPEEILEEASPNQVPTKKPSVSMRSECMAAWAIVDRSKDPRVLAWTKFGFSEGLEVPGTHLYQGIPGKDGEMKGVYATLYTFQNRWQGKGKEVNIPHPGSIEWDWFTEADAKAWFEGLPDRLSREDYLIKT